MSTYLRQVIDTKLDETDAITSENRALRDIKRTKKGNSEKSSR